MSEKKQIILIGGGGHCGSCIDVIEAQGQFEIAGIIDRKEKLHQSVLGYRVIACDADLPVLAQEYQYFLITLGQIESANKRVEKFQFLKQLGGKLPVIISPPAHVSKHARIGEGTIIMHRVFVNALAHVGTNCIINSGAIIEHDAIIGDHCHISTASVVNGTCKIGEKTFFGSNSVMLNNVTIAPNSVIGAGAVIAHSIEESGVYVGNPARKIR